MASASGSPASCISTDANRCSAVTNRVSVVPVIVIGTRGTAGIPEEDEVDVEDEAVEVDPDDEADVPVVDVVPGAWEQADEKAAPAGTRRTASKSARRNEGDL
jgi:hypothetical protein